MKKLILAVVVLFGLTACSDKNWVQRVDINKLERGTKAYAICGQSDGQNQMNKSINLAINYLKFLLKNPDEAQKIATNASKLVDGNGAKKIAQALIEL